MYYLLTESFKSQEEKLVTLIRETVPAERIYLLGSTLRTRRTESVFVQESPSCKYVSHYYMLVLTNSNSGLNAIQDVLETKSKQFISITAFVLTMFTFRALLEVGQRFATKVHKEAKLLYGSNEVLPIIEAHPEDIKEKNNSIYIEAKNKVVEFLAGADLYIIRKQTKLAAFMLHQATEQCLHALFELNTGMYLTTHNIDKLLRYCSMICYQIPEILPRNNEKEERLFQLLQKAYVGGRYDNNYSITVSELQEIRERVMELKDLMKDVAPLDFSKEL